MLMATLKFALTIITVIYVSNREMQSNALFARKTVQVNRFIGKCPRYHNLTIWVDRMKFTHVNGTLIINSIFTVSKDTSSHVKLTFALNRCKSREALDTCEVYPDISVSSMCYAIRANLPPFDQIFNRISPKLECPFKKGTYKIINATADETILALFPMEDVYAYANIYGYDKIDNIYKMTACMYTEGKLTVV